MEKQFQSVYVGSIDIPFPDCKGLLMVIMVINYANTIKILTLWLLELHASNLKINWYRIHLLDHCDAMTVKSIAGFMC